MYENRMGRPKKSETRPKPKLEPLNQWVVDALAFSRMTNTALAEMLGIDQSRVAEMKTGKRRVQADEIPVIARVTGLALPPDFGAPPLEAHDVRHPLTVPIVSAVSAGALKKPDVSDEQIGIIRVADIDPKGDWIALRVTGDSMDRISPPDSVILVNRKERRLVPNACYVVSDGDDGVTYKRFRPNPDRLEPVSTNPSHEPMFFEQEPAIIGRVRKTILDM